MTESATCAPAMASGTSLTSASGFTLSSRYLVDAGGQQVTELNGSGVWHHSNVFVAGKLTATYDAKGLHYQIADPLGSRRVQANVAGQTDEYCTSLPFGNDLNDPYILVGTSCIATSNLLGTQDDATEQHFTQKERDTESGNDYFFARYYTSALGRFTTPDWSAKVVPIPYAQLANPQTFNLYAYVMNNPIVHIDLDGHACNPNDWGCNPWSANSAQSLAVLAAQRGTGQEQQTSTQKRESADEAKAVTNMKKYGPAQGGLAIRPVRNSCGEGNHNCQYELIGKGSEKYYVFEHQTSRVTGGDPHGNGDYVTPGYGGKANRGIFFDDIGAGSQSHYACGLGWAPRTHTISGEPGTADHHQREEYCEVSERIQLRGH
jgi:RHS repeat-associated protein